MRTVNGVRNPAWADPTGVRIEMEVDFDELDEIYVPFTSYKNDPEPHSADLFNRAVAGEFGPIADYVPPADITGDLALLRMREQRNELLLETDYVETPTYWSQLTPEKQAEWTTYRNALRDITETVTDPVYVVTVSVHEDDPEVYVTDRAPNFSWPTKPA